MRQHIRLPIIGMLVAGLINLRQTDRKSQSKDLAKEGSCVRRSSQIAARRAYHEQVHGQGSWLLGRLGGFWEREKEETR